MKGPKIYCIINGDLVSDKAIIPIHWERMNLLVIQLAQLPIHLEEIRVDSPLHTIWKQK